MQNLSIDEGQEQMETEVNDTAAKGKKGKKKGKKKGNTRAKSRK
jgi:hypothetical protein